MLSMNNTFMLERRALLESIDDRKRSLCQVRAVYRAIAALATNYRNQFRDGRDAKALGKALWVNE